MPLREQFLKLGASEPSVRVLKTLIFKNAIIKLGLVEECSIASKDHVSSSDFDQNFSILQES
jgi:hypothetical protein